MLDYTLLRYNSVVVHEKSINEVLRRYGVTFSCDEVVCKSPENYAAARIIDTLGISQIKVILPLYKSFLMSV